MAPKDAQLIPTEILLHVGSFLPHLSKHLLSNVWRRWKKDAMEKHSNTWSTIMKDDRWLSKMEELGLHPYLVGSDVVRLYDGKKGPHYLVLCLAHNEHGGKTGKPDVGEFAPLLRECLQEREIVTRNGVGEYYFPEAHLTLNVRDALSNYHQTCISEPRHLVARKFGRPGFYSAYLNWKDDTFECREIEPEKVIGTRKGLTKDVSSILGLEFDHLHGTLPGRQHYFYYPGANLQVEEVWTEDSSKLAGWRRK
jgi:hypothetical protein